MGQPTEVSAKANVKFAKIDNSVFDSEPDSELESKTETPREKIQRQRRARHEQSEKTWVYVQANEVRYAEHRESILSEKNLAQEAKVGVFIWTETEGTGHTFISLHQNEKITIFTYGRFDDVGIIPAVGEGVLVKLEDENAEDYLLNELYRMNAKAFKVLDANFNLVLSHFSNLWNSSNNLPDSIYAKENAKLFGRVIDSYDLTGNNCTTHSVDAIKKSGSKLFTRDIMGWAYTEDFVIPSSLQDYMLKASSSFDMITINVTSGMKHIHNNKNHIQPLEGSGKQAEALGFVGNVVGGSGESSGYSGGTVGGILGSLNDA